MNGEKLVGKIKNIIRTKAKKLDKKIKTAHTIEITGAILMTLLGIGVFTELVTAVPISMYVFMTIAGLMTTAIVNFVNKEKMKMLESKFVKFEEQEAEMRQKQKEQAAEERNKMLARFLDTQSLNHTNDLNQDSYFVNDNQEEDILSIEDETPNNESEDTEMANLLLEGTYILYDAKLIDGLHNVKKHSVRKRQ